MMPQELQTHMEVLEPTKLYRLVLVTQTAEIIAKCPKSKILNTPPLPLATSAAMLYQGKTKPLSAVTDTTRENSTPPSYLLSFSAVMIKIDFSLFLVSGLSQTEELQWLYLY